MKNHQIINVLLSIWQEQKHRTTILTTLVEDMFQKKIDESFCGMPNVYGKADDIFIASCDDQGKDHNETLEKVFWVCRQENFKLNKDKRLFICTSIPFSGKIIS